MLDLTHNPHYAIVHHSESKFLSIKKGGRQGRTTVFAKVSISRQTFEGEEERK